ncbi:MAG: YebC/PmpR family DNA-binding transcriptional regulator [Peptostreptococcaceae bacterium]|nr:YebC/PmpR family DNA-binding transcriptional regulator [Peptostreptococcaceae bacterium]
MGRIGTIINRKGKQDAKRGKIFTKHARAIMVAAREGGPEIEYNMSLKSAVEKAKADNMPNDNIERAIKKGSGETDGEQFEEFVYEGYGPSGVAIMVEILTDNKNRAAADVRHIFSKNGGNLGSNGCVSFMFDRKGILVLSEEDNELDEETLMMEALDAGAEDIQVEDGFTEIITSMEEFARVRDYLLKDGYKLVKAELGYIPQTMSRLENSEDITKMENLIDMLEDNDDVQNLHHNWEMED